jgi:hypothetical protein
MMRTMNRTRSQRIGTELPSELPSEQETDSKIGHSTAMGLVKQGSLSLVEVESKHIV